MIVKEDACVEIAVASCVSTENVIIFDSVEKTPLTDNIEAKQCFCLIL